MGKQINLDIHPFSFSVSTSNSLLLDNIHRMYPIVSSDASFIPDYRVSVKAPSLLKQYFRPSVSFLCDDREPFLPMPQDKAYAMLEWGMNWVVASHEVQHVVIHSAVLAKGNKAVLFPAPPGSGKSTLTSWLCHNGWRLLSDEMAIIEPETSTVLPSVRPICLKNNSISLVKEWGLADKLSSIAKNTHKGDVAHLTPPPDSWEQRKVPAKIVGIVYPRYDKNTFCDVYDLNQLQSLNALAKNSINHSVLDKRGFNTVVKLVDNAKSFEVCYNNVNELQQFLEQDVIV